MSICYFLVVIMVWVGMLDLKGNKTTKKENREFKRRIITIYELLYSRAIFLQKTKSPKTLMIKKYIYTGLRAILPQGLLMFAI